MTDPLMEPFAHFASQFLADETRQILNSNTSVDFVERLSEAIEDLPPRRRHAVMLLLLTLAEGLVDPSDVADWLGEHDVTDDNQVDELVGWLRARRQDHQH